MSNGKIIKELKEIRKLEKLKIIDMVTSIRKQAKIFRKIGIKI